MGVSYTSQEQMMTKEAVMGTETVALSISRRNRHLITHTCRS